MFGRDHTVSQFWMKPTCCHCFETALSYCYSLQQRWENCGQWVKCSPHEHSI